MLCSLMFIMACCKVKCGSNDNKVSEISSSHGGEYDVQSCLLGYTAM
jgi:hypothetical protein